ncbi:MAG: hypothetical protein QOI54_1869 [Actinomycetota bacterium]|nr:hypothetical protein [Actinomycetota bacterium]
MVGQSGRRAVAVSLGSALVAALLVAAPSGAAATTRTVSFRGVSVTVPAGWPVVRVDGATGCVRFDRHAVYLGDPSTSNCPAEVSGHVEAVHLTRGEVLDARSPEADVGAGRTVTGGSAVHPDMVVSHARSPVRAVVTSGADHALAAAVARSVRFSAAGLTGAPVSAAAPPPSQRIVASGPVRATGSATPASRSWGAASRQALATTYSGLGFDTCLTPSLDDMAAWSASPYRAVNMYVGGASRGCPNQPNLNATWVSTVVGQGWTLIPTYVGLQAPCAARYPNRISIPDAAAQGSASADDAIAVLNAIGLGTGSIVYFDMEAYDTSNAACVGGVQTFLDAWTARLHARDYLSGVYTSSTPMKATLVDKLADPSFHQPDDIWFARWNNDPAVFGDPAIPDSAWANHQRIHQYRGGHTETWGGVTINIDNDSLDADTAPGAPLSEGTFVSERASSTIYRIAGGAPLPVTSWAPFGGPQPVEVVSGTRWRLLPTYPRNGTFLQGAGTGQVFRVSGGFASFVPTWDAFGGPQATTTVDPEALANAGAGGVFNHLKSVKPSVSMLTPATRGTTASSLRVQWLGAVSAPALKSYDLRYRKARYNGSFSAWTYLKPWQNTAASAKTKTLVAGWSYCFQVRAHNRIGQSTPWSPTRCVSRAVDDRSLSASNGWKRWKSRAFYGRTVTSTTRKGVTLSLGRATVARVGVVATTCAACGKLAVYAGGRRVATVDLASPTTVHQAVLMLGRFTRRTGTITLKTLTSGRLVQLDGLVAMRT